MLSYGLMERQKRQRYNLRGNISVQPRRFDEAFEPYRNAFILGDIQQQNVIINELVSSLVSAETCKLTEERGNCMEEVKPKEEEVFTCNLCQELFHLPVTLLCGHTFCLGCLENYQRQGRTICPGCGLESNLRYTSNIVVRQLARVWFPEKTDIRNCIAEANKLLNEGKMREFREFTNNLSTKYPENVDILYLRANGSKCMKNYSDALKDLDFACGLAPFCSKVLHARGELLARLDEPEEAMAMFLRASALKPNDPTYRCSLTSYLEKLLRNICNSSIPCIPSSTNNTAPESTVKKVLKRPPIKSEINFDESATTARNLPRGRQIPNETQVDHEAIRTDPTDHGNESTFRTNLTEKMLVAKDKMEVEEENITEAQSHERVSCIQRNIMVPPKSNIPSELECKLCFNLLYEPVTTPCGHSLCRSCLRRCLDHRFDCPCCRTNLQNYLEHFLMGNVGTSKVLERILLLKFNEEYQARRISYEKDLLEFSR